MTTWRLSGVGRRILVHTWVFVLLVAVWELIARQADKFYFPTLSSILRDARQLWLSGPPSHLWLDDTVGHQIVPSLVRLAGGFALAAVAGVAGGFAIGRSQALADLVDPIVHFMRSVPPVALVPIFMLLFGIGTNMRILLIAFTSVWPILLNTIDGVREIEPMYLDTARVFGINRRRMLRSVILPATLPRIFAGLRISSALALIVMVVSEMTAATSGVGYSLTDAQQAFRYADMWAYILLLGVIGWLLNVIIKVPERLLLSWQQTDSERGES